VDLLKKQHMWVDDLAGEKAGWIYALQGEYERHIAVDGKHF
jgi:hypothetical protein